MNLHTRTSQDNPGRKRIGRGGKRGTTSGRGTKGQKSRSGHVLRPAERDLILRIPKKRGFRNKPKSEKPLLMKLSDFVLRALPLATQGGEITIARLREAGIISSRVRHGIKLVGSAKVDAKFILKGIEVSKGVKDQVEKAGGKAE